MAEKRKEASVDMRSMALKEINPATYNPRVDLKPNDPEYQRIEASINGFGYADPLIVNSFNNVLISGHQRLKILMALGYTHASVSVVKIDKLEKEKAMNLAMNKIAGREDPAKLKEIFLEFESYGEMVKLAGYEEEEFNRMKKWDENTVADDVLKSVSHASKFEVIIECSDEKQQKKIYDEMSERDLKCRVLAF